MSKKLSEGTVATFAIIAVMILLVALLFSGPAKAENILNIENISGYTVKNDRHELQLHPWWRYHQAHQWRKAQQIRETPRFMDFWTCQSFGRLVQCYRF